MSASRGTSEAGVGFRAARAAALVLASAALVAPAGVRAQAADRFLMVATRGADTLSVERVIRTADTLRTQILVPGRARHSVVAALDPRGCVTGATSDVFPWGSAEGSTPVQHVGVRAEGDSLRVEVRARDVVQRTARPAPGVEFVMAGDSWAASALLVECALAAGDSSTIHVAAFPGLRLEDMTVVRRGREVTVSGADTSHVTLGPDGATVLLRPAGSGITVARAPWTEAAPAAPRTDYGPPPGAPYTAQDVSIPVEGGVTLAGTLTLPPTGGAPAPAVVLVSGGGAQDRDSYAPVGGGWRPFRELAHALSSRGVAVLRFDDRGVGMSTGDFGAATEREGLRDVQAALRFLRARGDIAGDRVALLGHSEGARVAMWASAEDASVAALVLLAGAADPKRATLAQARWQLDHAPGITPEVRDSLLLRAERQFDSLATTGTREVYRWDAPALAQRIRIPVAVFHGSSDKQVPPAEAEALGALLRGAGTADVTVRVIPGVNHLFVPDPSGDFLRYGELTSGKLDPRLLEEVAAWLAARLVPR